MYSQQDHLLKLWEASRMALQNGNNSNDFLAHYQSQRSPSLSNFEMSNSSMLPFDSNYNVGQQRYDQQLFGLSNQSFASQTTPSWPSLNLLAQTSSADINIQNYLNQALQATEKISNNCNTISSRVQQELAYLNFKIQQESSNGVGLKQNYQFTSKDAGHSIITPDLTQQYYIQQQQLQQQKYQHQQSQNNQPISTSSITSSPNISNIQLPKIEDHGVLPYESDFSKNFLNLHSSAGSSNMTQRRSSFPSQIQADGQKMNPLKIKIFNVKSEQSERTLGQNQRTASFKDMHLQGQSIQIQVDSFERKQQMDHSLYLSLPSILSKQNSLKYFTSFFSSSPDQATSDINTLGATTEALLLPYDRLIKQRIFEIQYQKHQQSQNSFQDTIQETSSITSLQSSPLSKIQDILQSSNSSRTLGDASLVSCLELKPNKKYEVYTHLQKMCETFIRGDKKKRFKERNPQSQYMSQFHNLNRLFFYQVMSIYSYESLSCFEIDPIVSETLRTAVSFIKIHSKLRIEKGSQEDTTNDKNSKKRQRSEVDDEKSLDGATQLTKKIRTNSQIDKENNDNLNETEDQFYSTIKSEENVQNDHTNNSSIDTNEDSVSSPFPNNSDTGLGKWHIKEFKQTFKTVKVENYTHAHYNTLFLKLTPESMVQLKKHSKDIESHWLSFKVDLRRPELIPPEKIIYVNLLKALFYKIFVHFNNVTPESKQKHFDTIMTGFRSGQDSSDDQEAVKLRLDYYHRVVLGIHKLKDGIYMHKF